MPAVGEYTRAVTFCGPAFDKTSCTGIHAPANFSPPVRVILSALAVSLATPVSMLVLAPPIAVYAGEGTSSKEANKPWMLF
jgi:hypothetical protein